MRIFALTVGKNEESRYLKKMITSVGRFVDGHFFYDDQSVDRTPLIALNHGCVVAIRPSSELSFLEHEGLFRQAAWRAFEDAMEPRGGDWVLTIDCDELFVSMTGGGRWEFEVFLRSVPSYSGVILDIDEVFGYDENGQPLVRTDGLWGTIRGPRLFPYRERGTYDTMKLMGAPGQPTYVAQGPLTETRDYRIVHYGYAEQEDQEQKFRRYTERLGHAVDHVNSIVSPEKILIPLKVPQAWSKSA